MKNRTIIEERLVELIDDSEMASEILDEVDGLEENIRMNNIVTRDNEEVEEEVADTEETGELEVEFEIDEELYKQIVEEVNGSFASQFQALSERIDEVLSKYSESETEVEALRVRVADLERQDEEKIAEAIEDIPASRKNKVSVRYRPSEQNQDLLSDEANEQEEDILDFNKVIEKFDL